MTGHRRSPDPERFVSDEGEFTFTPPPEQDPVPTGEADEESADEPRDESPEGR